MFFMTLRCFYINFHTTIIMHKYDELIINILFLSVLIFNYFYENSQRKKYFLTFFFKSIFEYLVLNL